jgi:hypothetical protein
MSRKEVADDTLSETPVGAAGTTLGGMGEESSLHCTNPSVVS